MGTSRDGRSRRLTTLGACLMVVATLGLSPAASASRVVAQMLKSHAPCSRKTWWIQPNAQFGDTKDFGVKLKGAEEPGPLEVVVAIHNPRIEICSASISVLEGVEGGGYRKVVFAVRIGRHGGLSSKLTLPPSGHFYAPEVTVLARLK